jgi:hypothetical protein
MGPNRATRLVERLAQVRERPTVVVELKRSDAGYVVLESESARALRRHCRTIVAELRVSPVAVDAAASTNNTLATDSRLRRAQDRAKRR